MNNIGDKVKLTDGCEVVITEINNGFFIAKTENNAHYFTEASIVETVNQEVKPLDKVE